MREFKDYNPISLFVFFAGATIISMFTMNPIIVGISFVASIFSNIIIKKRIDKRNILVLIFVFFITALINPLVSHNGFTVLFVLNDNPITMEACIYGIIMGVIILSVILWFGLFSYIMTSDKILYLFGNVSPKLALIISMILRYIPLFRKQSDTVNDYQKALGLYKEDNLVDTVRGKLRIFSIMLSWGLENGIVTAESMDARGYGVKRRTSYSIIRFRRSDLFLIIIIVLLMSGTLLGMISGFTEFQIYPYISYSEISIQGIFSYICYSVLVFLPIIIEGRADIRWNYLKSKI